LNAPRLRLWSPVAALLLTCGAAQVNAAADAELRPFTASYSVNNRSGSAEIKLEQLADGNWSYQQRIRVNSLLARLFLPSELSSRSLFSVQNSQVIPAQFTAEDGAGSSSRDQKLDFDWNRARVTGTFERKPVDLPTQPGLLDSLSVQVALMLELMAGRTPQRFVLVDKGRIKEYAYTYEGNEVLRTAVGEQRALIYRSSRAGSNKSTVFWCAPNLGYLPLKVERRDGKSVEATLILKSLEFGGPAAQRAADAR
jgi:hypothetical protein